MGKVNKVVVFGKTKTGKTAIINKIIYPDSNMVGVDLCPTIEDCYMGSIESDRANGPKGPEKERVCFYDTAGLESPRSEVPKHYISMADGFILVYSIDNMESFLCVQKLKRDIDTFKAEKKEVTIIAIGNKCDLEANRQVTKKQAETWATQEKVLFREATVADRKTLHEPVVQMVSKMTQPPMEKGGATSSDHHHLLPFHVTPRPKSPSRGILKGIPGGLMTTSIGRKASTALGFHTKEPKVKDSSKGKTSQFSNPKPRK